jgi:nucleotide-binding universal stress UspA family protein
VIGSIVVGTDGSDTAAMAVREAGDLAEKVGARVHVERLRAGLRAGGGRGGRSGE